MADGQDAGQVIPLAALSDKAQAEPVCDGLGAAAHAAAPDGAKPPGKRRYIPLKTAGKRLRKHMALLLNLPVRDEEGLEKLRRLGVAEAEANNSMLLCAALLGRATATGDISAIKEIRNILGSFEEDKPAQAGMDGQLEALIQGLKTEEA